MKAKSLKSGLNLTSYGSKMICQLTQQTVRRAEKNSKQWTWIIEVVYAVFWIQDLQNLDGMIESRLRRSGRVFVYNCDSRKAEFEE